MPPTILADQSVKALNQEAGNERKTTMTDVLVKALGAKAVEQAEVASIFAEQISEFGVCDNYETIVDEDGFTTVKVQFGEPNIVTKISRVKRTLAEQRIAEVRYHPDKGMWHRWYIEIKDITSNVSHMDEDEALSFLANRFKLSVGSLRRVIHDCADQARRDAQAAEDEITAREQGRGPTVINLPDQSQPAEPWPSKKWAYAQGKILGKKQGILKFLRDEWEPFILRTGTIVTRDVLAEHDPDAERAFTRYLEKHDFPKGISILYPQQLMKLSSEHAEFAQMAMRLSRGPGM